MRIQTSDGGSRVIQECQSSLISRIAGTALCTLRVYALLAPEDVHRGSAMAAQINQDLGPLW